MKILNQLTPIEWRELAESFVAAFLGFGLLVALLLLMVIYEIGIRPPPG